jgi:uncharacterized protein GlcG (DUF336 family)
MHRFFFTAEYKGATLRDDDGELFATEAQAIAHGRLIANELGRNNPKPVSVSVLDEAGHILATARAGHDAAIDRSSRLCSE